MSKPTQYDPNIIQTFADALYARAASIVATCTICGTLFGIVPLVIVSITGANKSGESGLIFFLILIALLGGLIGFRIGKAKAFDLKLKAQEALCQVQIEKNTRKNA